MSYLFTDYWLFWSTTVNRARLSATLQSDTMQRTAHTRTGLSAGKTKRQLHNGQKNNGGVHNSYLARNRNAVSLLMTQPFL